MRLPIEEEASGDCGVKAAPGRHWIAWAVLRQRVFDHEILVCPRCEGDCEVIAAISDDGQPLVVQAIIAAGACGHGEPRLYSPCIDFYAAFCGPAHFGGEIRR